jgi:hypothetical protein
MSLGRVARLKSWMPPVSTWGFANILPRPFDSSKLPGVHSSSSLAQLSRDGFRRGSYAFQPSLMALTQERTASGHPSDFSERCSNAESPIRVVREAPCVATTTTNYIGKDTYKECLLYLLCRRYNPVKDTNTSTSSAPRQSTLVGLPKSK